MPAVWFTLKRSMQCKSEPATEVHDPKSNGGSKLSSISTRKTSRSGCSRSIANLRDVIHGSKRHVEKPEICSPRSIGSSELINPITHEVVLNNSTCELKIMNCGESDSRFEDTTTDLKKEKVVGNSPIRRSSSSLSRRRSTGFASASSRNPQSFGADSAGLSTTITCHMCNKQFTKWDSAEEHHLSKHAVSELVEGDSSRKIVELICRTSWAKSAESSCGGGGGGGIERTLKVHNMQNKLADFEEYREMVKIKANKLAKKHPRCLADGNELLRFHGTTLECALGSNGSSTLCTDHKCRVCRILRHGFSTKDGVSNGSKIGVFTASTSSRALESIEFDEDIGESPFSKKALIVCRVIAGRVHKPLENVQELVGQSGFDSLAGKVGIQSNIEELYLLNARALLPCFVVICK